MYSNSMVLSVAPFHYCHGKIKGGLYGLLVGDAMGPLRIPEQASNSAQRPDQYAANQGYGNAFNTTPDNC